MIYYNKYLKTISILIFLLTSIFFVSAGTFNTNGDFQVVSNVQKSTIFNDNIKTNFTFDIQNTETSSQKINLFIPQINGWDIILSSNNFTLSPGEKKIIDLNLVANSQFSYKADIIGPNEFKITQQKDYKGYFTFPLKISGDENFSLNFEVEIDTPNNPLSYKTLFASHDISPNSDLKYSINGINVDKLQNVDVLVELNNIKISSFKDTFSKTNSYKIYSSKISSKFKPGKYNAKVTVRYFDKDKNSAREWYGEDTLNVINYKNLEVTSTITSSILKDKYLFEIKNNGNIDSIYTKKINVSFLESFFFTTNLDYSKNNNVITFSIPVKKAETSQLIYYYNYTYLYLFLIILILAVIYLYYKENSNPLKVDTKFYNIHKDVNEGFKSFKVRLGFESIKHEELEDIKLIFKMPSYLAVKENSFLLSEPNKVLKGTHQYKLIWKFKDFEYQDSRILGFTLQNKKGILGDIQIDDLEFEIKINGKIKKYFYSLPIIKS